MNKSNFVALIFTLLFNSVLFGQNSIARQQAMQLINEGDSYLKLGGWSQALVYYTNAIQTDPEYAEAYMKRGQLNERILRKKEAELDYSTAINLNPLIDIYYDQRARIKILSFNYYGAMEDITKAISLNASNSQYQKHQIDGYIALGMYDNALKKLDSINFETLDSLYILQRTALVYLLNDNLIGARTAIYKAMEIDESDYMTIDILGILDLKDKNYESALQLFSQAIAIDSTQPLSFYNRGVCYRFLGEPELALKDINKSIKLDNQQQAAFYKRALIRKEKGDFNGSIADYKSAIKIDSTYIEAIYNRSFTYKVMGDYLNAEKEIDYLINIGVEKPEYWNMKGNLQVLHGNVNDAIDSYTRAIDVNQNYADAYYNRGIANLLLNQSINACLDLQKSSTLGSQKAAEVILHFCGY